VAWLIRERNRLILKRSQLRTGANAGRFLNRLLPKGYKIRGTVRTLGKFGASEMNTGGTSDIMRFSTDALPERDRTAIWHDVFGRHIVKTQFEPIANAWYVHEATLRSLPGLSLITSTCAGFRAERTRKIVAEGDDDLIFTVNTEGVAYASQLGRETPIAAGEGVLLSSADIGAIGYPDRARFVAFRIPRKTLDPVVSDLEAGLARRLPRSEALSLLTTYAAAFDDQAMTSPLLRQAFATHIEDLLVLAIGGTFEAAEVARSRGLRAVRLKAIKNDIVTNISDERLSVTDVARRHRVTPRYVQLLFESDGGTFSEYVIEQRLGRACRMLTETRFADWTIGAIAFEAGFSNLSYFNRTFRRRYGATPSDMRARARGKEI
jgi:AraC-like DNA-binding protein